MLENYQPPSCFVIFYLYQQLDRCINWDLDQLIDEGSKEFAEEESTATSSIDVDPTMAPLSYGKQ